MNSNKKTQTKTLSLIGNENHTQILEFQAKYAIAKRGGSYSHNTNAHNKRIVSDLNLLSSYERQVLVYNEIIFNN